MASKASAVRGLLGVIVALGISGLWSFWGAIECFHEGWYYHSLVDNLRLALVQYWCWPIAFSGLAALSIAKPKIGASLFVAIGLLTNAVLFHFQNMAGFDLMLLPCLLLAALFGFGSVPRPKLAVWIVVSLPLLVMIVISLPLLIKVSNRVTVIRNEPLVWATGVETLVWAPPGPGWPDKGVTYANAQWICDHLSYDGRTISAKRLQFWRLPSIHEAEHAMTRHGKMAGCDYSGKPGWQPCQIQPDKEAPIWNPFSQVIYWWTASDDDRGDNLRISYNGYVLPVQKRLTGYTAFRAVREPSLR